LVAESGGGVSYPAARTITQRSIRSQVHELHDNLEFKHLKAIVAIADEGTFTAADLSLLVAQFALSRQISLLEY
jgi:hypothetical protein